MVEKEFKNENKTLDIDEIEETMLGPLWARATYSQKFPELLEDQKASEIIQNVDYDFTEVGEFLGEWRAVGLMIRARRFDDALREYIKKFPNATVVNIGAGLDTTFFRVDNGKIKMYNLDLPNVIKLRRRLIKETERNENIAQSVFKGDWMDKIDYSENDGIFFIAGGFIYYFIEDQISKLLKTLANEFPGGEMIFDSISSLASKMMNKRAEKAGSDLRINLSIDDPYEMIPSWSERIEIKDCFIIGDRIKNKDGWKIKTKIMNKATNWLKTSRIIHLKFLK